MTFHRSENIEVALEDWSRAPSGGTAPIRKKQERVDGSNPLGPETSKNPSQKKMRPGILSSTASKKKINTRNNSQQKKPKEQPFSNSGSAEESKGKKSKYPAPMNSIPRARQRRIPIGRNRD